MSSMSPTRLHGPIGQQLRVVACGAQQVWRGALLLHFRRIDGARIEGVEMAEVIGEVVLLVDLAGRPRFWLLRREECVLLSLLIFD